MIVKEKFLNGGAEGLFKYLCSFNDWNCTKIPEAKIRTPDFSIETTKGNFICEVKQLKSVGYKIGKVFSFTVGNKVREAIGKAKGQLRNQDQPTLLMLYDENRSGICGYESIVSAMYGSLTVDININTGKTGEFYYGKNSKIQKDINTSISAVADLSFSKEENIITPILTVYHNMYAKHPFSELFFEGIDSVYEYRFLESEAA